MSKRNHGPLPANAENSRQVVCWAWWYGLPGRVEWEDVGLSSRRLAVCLVNYRAFLYWLHWSPKPSSEAEILLLAGRLSFVLPRGSRGETGLLKHFPMYLKTTRKLVETYWYLSSIWKQPTDFHGSVDYKVENHSRHEALTSGTNLCTHRRVLYSKPECSHYLAEEWVGPL